MAFLSTGVTVSNGRRWLCNVPAATYINHPSSSGFCSLGAEAVAQSWMANWVKEIEMDVSGLVEEVAAAPWLAA
jgi:hypothetical protein